MIKYFTIEDLLKHYLQKKFHILAKANGNLFFCIPKATNNYIFIDAEWEIK